MAIHGLHWKWRSLTPCQRHPSKMIEKIFGTIDYVIDLNNLAKFGFGEIFPDGGTHTQHIRVCPFFKFFKFIFLTLYALWWGCSQNGWTDFDAQYVIRRRLVRIRPFFRNKKYRSMTLTLKRSKSGTRISIQTVRTYHRHSRPCASQVSVSRSACGAVYEQKNTWWQRLFLRRLHCLEQSSLFPARRWFNAFFEQF